jgi:hypothetical protein
MSEEDRVQGLRDVRKTLADMIVDVDRDVIVSLRATIDQIAAAARDAGYGPEQIGAVVLWRIAQEPIPPGPATLLEQLAPGWNTAIILGVLMEVFDDAS